MPIHGPTTIQTDNHTTITDIRNHFVGGKGIFGPTADGLELLPPGTVLGEDARKQVREILERAVAAERIPRDSQDRAYKYLENNERNFGPFKLRMACSIAHDAPEECIEPEHEHEHEHEAVAQPELEFPEPQSVGYDDVQATAKLTPNMVVGVSKFGLVSDHFVAFGKAFELADDPANPPDGGAKPSPEEFKRAWEKTLLAPLPQGKVNMRPEADVQMARLILESIRGDHALTGFGLDEWLKIFGHLARVPDDGLGFVDTAHALAAALLAEVPLHVLKTARLPLDKIEKLFQGARLALVLLRKRDV